MLWPTSVPTPETDMHKQLFPIMARYGVKCRHSGGWIGGGHVEFEFAVPDGNEAGFVGALVQIGFTRDGRTVN
jgi:hypothetical protein